MTRRSGAVAVLLAAVIAGAPGCSRTGGSSIDARVTATLKASAAAARKSGYVEQAEALEDGEVSDAEYDELFSLFQECLVQSGIQLDPPVVSPIDGRRKLWWPAGDGVFETEDEMREASACQLRYVTDVEGAVGERPRRMAEPLRASVRACLSERGIDIAASDDDIRKVMQAATGEHEDAVASCVSEGVLENYPEIRAIPFVPPVVY